MKYLMLYQLILLDIMRVAKSLLVQVEQIEQVLIEAKEAKWIVYLWKWMQIFKH